MFFVFPVTYFTTVKMTVKVSPQNGVLYSGQVTLLVEGARAVVAHHQLRLFIASAEETLVVVLLILLPTQTRLLIHHVYSSQN